MIKELKSILTISFPPFGIFDSGVERQNNGINSDIDPVEMFCHKKTRRQLEQQ